MGWQFLAAKNNQTGYIANANIFGSSITIAPIQPPSKIVIFANFSQSGILTLRRTLQGGTVISEILNSNTVLVGNCHYGFDSIIDSAETIDFQYSVNCTINKLTISESVGESD